MTHPLTTHIAAVREALEHAKTIIPQWCHTQGDNREFHADMMQPIHKAFQNLSAIETALREGLSRELNLDADKAKLEDAIEAAVMNAKMKTAEEWTMRFWRHEFKSMEDFAEMVSRIQADAIAAHAGEGK